MMKEHDVNAVFPY